jgi:hypothetical protein
LKPEDVLGLFIRVFGLMIAAYAFYSEFFAAIEVAGFTPSAHETASTHALFGVLYLLIGVVIVKAADYIVKFSYGTKLHRGRKPE